jgi:hypothetical protein
MAVALYSCASGPGNEGGQTNTGKPLISFSQEITSPTTALQMVAGQTYPIQIVVKNSSTDTWASGQGALSVTASYRWFGKDGKMLPIEGNRAYLPRPIHAGDSATLALPVTAPPQPGTYDMWISMVQEGVAWFFLKGAKPLIVHVTVT